MSVDEGHRVEFKRLAITVLSVILSVTALWAGSFRVKMAVTLKVPAGYNQWVLSPTCSMAWYLATNERSRSAIRFTEAVTYSQNAQAVIKEIDEDDDTCVYVETVPDRKHGWVYSILVEMTAADRKKVAAEIKAAEEKRQTERKAADEKRQTERRRLESLPRLTGPAPNVIVAVDEGCFKDVLKLKQLAGIELRKKGAELVLYHCAFLAPINTHVEASKMLDGSYYVVLQDGPVKGQTGIVAAESIQR